MLQALLRDDFERARRAFAGARDAFERNQAGCNAVRAVIGAAVFDRVEMRTALNRRRRIAAAHEEVRGAILFDRKTGRASP